MNKFEFISYQETPGEKHLGIATINVYGKIIVRVKIVPNKDGTGFFINCAKFKVGSDYLDSFLLESRSEDAEMERVIKEGVKKSMRSIVAVNSAPDVCLNILCNCIMHCLLTQSSF